MAHIVQHHVSATPPLLSQVAAGGATLDEIMPILRERERRSELDRASAARRRAKQKAERR